MFSQNEKNRKGNIKTSNDVLLESQDTHFKQFGTTNGLRNYTNSDYSESHHTNRSLETSSLSSSWSHNFANNARWARNEKLNSPVIAAARKVPAPENPTEAALRSEILRLAVQISAGGGEAALQVMSVLSGKLGADGSLLLPRLSKAF
mmetsp:Transcript_70680/g.188664  ORF Transcript_70680/g.188664 Transcript_70680/m.188664 type:complete len:148 (-) Transcript_70680:104-547(-)